MRLFLPHTRTHTTNLAPERSQEIVRQLHTQTHMRTHTRTHTRTFLERLCGVQQIPALECRQEVVRQVLDADDAASGADPRHRAVSARVFPRRPADQSPIRSINHQSKMIRRFSCSGNADKRGRTNFALNGADQAPIRPSLSDERSWQQVAPHVLGL